MPFLLYARCTPSSPLRVKYEKRNAFDVLSPGVFPDFVEALVALVVVGLVAVVVLPLLVAPVVVFACEVECVHAVATHESSSKTNGDCLILLCANVCPGV